MHNKDRPSEIDSCPPRGFQGGPLKFSPSGSGSGREKWGRLGHGYPLCWLLCIRSSPDPISRSQASTIAANWAVDSWNYCHGPGSASQLQKPEESLSIFHLGGQPSQLVPNRSQPRRSSDNTARPSELPDGVLGCLLSTSPPTPHPCHTHTKGKVSRMSPLDSWIPSIMLCLGSTVCTLIMVFQNTIVNGKALDDTTLERMDLSHTLL